MTHARTWVLTDAAADIWVEGFGIDNSALRLSTAHAWSIHKRTLRGGLRDGVDLIEVNNGTLSYSILPTRGMGLWRGEYRGTFLGWRSPVPGPVHPKFVDPQDRGGIGWLTGFDEWLCRCGLASNGPPGEDVHTERSGAVVRDRLTLHGRIANLPAQYVEVRVGLEAPHELTVIGRVEEAGLFYPHLSLTAAFTTVPGSNRVVIHDVIENRAARPAEVQLLYHCNVGPPLLEAGSRVLVPLRELAPKDGRAAEGMATYDTYGGPATGFAEQVYLYDPLADAGGRTLALLYNRFGDRGLVVRFNRHELPCFTVWRNTGAVEDGYVTGLEPATNYPNFKGFEREHGRVVVLPPGGRWECKWSLEVHDTPAGVAGVQAEIARLQAHAPALLHRTPQPRFSPA
jgi:hypothetical protein